MAVDVPMTFGSLLIGAIISVLLSGVTWAQTFIYLKVYPDDATHVKVLVLATWLLDTLHSIFISASLWAYLIVGFGHADGIDAVPTALALTIIATAILTFTVQLFFIHRIFVLAKSNYYIASPIAFLALARLCFACMTTARLIQYPSLAHFVANYSWSFTTGLTLSAIVDVLITGFMCYLLKRRQQQYSSLNQVLDTLILYAFENGILTTVAALLSLITWLTMKHNLIFMAAHFVILKFYANSLLATLNARQDLKPSSVTMHTTNLRSNGSGLASDIEDSNDMIKAPPQVYGSFGSNNRASKLGVILSGRAPISQSHQLSPIRSATSLTNANTSSGRINVSSNNKHVAQRSIVLSQTDDDSFVDFDSGKPTVVGRQRTSQERRSGAPFHDIERGLSVGWGDAEKSSSAPHHPKLKITVNTTQVQVVDDDHILGTSSSLESVSKRRLGY